MFKSLAFYLLGFFLSSVTTHLDSVDFVIRGSVRALKICQSCGQSCFLDAAVSKGRCLPVIPRRNRI